MFRVSESAHHFLLVRARVGDTTSTLNFSRHFETSCTSINMRLFSCLISGDEMFTDNYKYEETDGMFILKGKFITRKAGDVDESAIGGNPSQEEAADGYEGEMESGVDIILNNRLAETAFGTKKEYQAFMKDYMKRVIDILKESGKSEDEVQAMKDATQLAFKDVYPRFKEFQFFTGASMNPDGHIALLEWKDEDVDGETKSIPYVYFYRAGLKAEKL